MAKKKKSFPSKKCPKCNKTLHAAKRKCSKCGYEFPAKKKKRKKRSKKAARSVSVSASDGVLSQKLAESIRVVEKAGGLVEAKKVLSAVKLLEK